MNEVKRYNVKIKYYHERQQEMNPYAYDEEQAKQIALKMFEDTTREYCNAEVAEVKEINKCQH